jgi:hypothetical protein
MSYQNLYERYYLFQFYSCIAGRSQSPNQVYSLFACNFSQEKDQHNNVEFVRKFIYF